MKGGIQLPDDVKSVGYKRSTTNRFEFEQVFHSQSHNFTGTEREFVARGLGYEYVELDKYTRRVIPKNK